MLPADIKAYIKPPKPTRRSRSTVPSPVPNSSPYDPCLELNSHGKQSKTLTFPFLSKSLCSTAAQFYTMHLTKNQNNPLQLILPQHSSPPCWCALLASTHTVPQQEPGSCSPADIFTISSHCFFPFSVIIFLISLNCPSHYGKYSATAASHATSVQI